MPEGPEVEVVSRGLNALRGKELLNIQLYPARSQVVKNNLQPLVNKKLLNVERKGKFLLFEFEEQNYLKAHLAMTGAFLLTDDSTSSILPREEHLVFRFDFIDGDSLYFSDKRGFAQATYLDANDLKTDKALNSIGVDGLTASVEDIAQALVSNSRREIKPWLLDYKNIAGIGNIYACEALYEAEISPFKRVRDLSDSERMALAQAISHILHDALQAGGSSISNYSNARGEAGTFQKKHQVYRKAICSNCGSEIWDVKQNGRTTYYCPGCQG